jgi:heme/copper-type cytochrome/quinol oxidase subunit 4|tara:strand:- start:1845 stop:2009 length:165 start_codon:yes stop_codon:yes gene_type:complete
MFNKKAQLGFIEFRFFFIGFIIAMILTIAVIYMANNGIVVPFKLGFVCPAAPVP